MFLNFGQMYTFTENIKDRNTILMKNFFDVFYISVNNEKQKHRKQFSPNYHKISTTKSGFISTMSKLKKL